MPPLLPARLGCDKQHVVENIPFRVHKCHAKEVGKTVGEGDVVVEKACFSLLLLFVALRANNDVVLSPVGGAGVTMMDPCGAGVGGVGEGATKPLVLEVGGLVKSPPALVLLPLS